MNKKLLAVSVLLGLLLLSAVSAGHKDKIRALPTVQPNLLNLAEDIGERFNIPPAPHIPTKADAGFYAESSKGAGLWGYSPSKYQGVYGSSTEGTGVAALTEKGPWAVWAYNREAETTGWLGAFRTGVLGLVKNKNLFAGEFLGGKGIYSEKGYATRNEKGQLVQMLPGTYTFETVDGKLVTVTNGIITAIKSKTD